MKKHCLTLAVSLMLTISPPSASALEPGIRQAAGPMEYLSSAALGTDLSADDWNRYFISPTYAASQGKLPWLCDLTTMPQLSGTRNDNPADRCWIDDPPPGYDLSDAATRYILNGVKPVLNTTRGVIYYFVQANHLVGYNKNAPAYGVWSTPQGPGSWMDGNGDEFWLFTSSTSYGGAMNHDGSLKLLNDVMRVDSPPEYRINYQFKDVVFDERNGRTTAVVRVGYKPYEAESGGSGFGLIAIEGFRKIRPENLDPANDYTRIMYVCHSDVLEAWEPGCSNAAEHLPIRLDYMSIKQASDSPAGAFRGYFSWLGLSGTWYTTPYSMQWGQWIAVPFDNPANPQEPLWQTFPWGVKLTQEPWKYLTGRLSNHVTVTFTGGEYDELWMITTETENLSTPCGTDAQGNYNKPPQYLSNVLEYANLRGRGEGYALFDAFNQEPVEPFSGNPPYRNWLHWSLKTVAGNEYAWPGGYNDARTWLSGSLIFPGSPSFTWDKRFHYWCSKDDQICDTPIIKHGTGKGCSVLSVGPYSSNNMPPASSTTFVSTGGSSF